MARSRTLDEAAHAAELLGVADNTATLPPGKLADIIALAGSPAVDITRDATPGLRGERGGVIYVGATSGSDKSGSDESGSDKSGSGGSGSLRQGPNVQGDGKSGTGN